MSQPGMPVAFTFDPRGALMWYFSPSDKVTYPSLQLVAPPMDINEAASRALRLSLRHCQLAI